ncbi:hypothetical protein [Klebsiella michiganensis]|uniref:hypothetical protein n=1 Tax=Klebsiella michiganensis TaxID=1134687 RepID=UPI001F4F4BA3|nr:hypothetical protein [Klebsiella michiganensis]
MTSKLTRERIEWLNYAATGLAANGTEMAMSPQDVIALTECCLAAMDSEPVAFINGAWTLVYYRPPKESGLKIGDKLYRHAQQPVVPDEKPMPNPLSMYAVDAVAAIAEVKGWNTCRAAMLQAGNSPVIPDGYVMVPKEMTDEIGEAIAMQANCCGGIALDIYDAMLAAAPQEVKGE